MSRRSTYTLHCRLISFLRSGIMLGTALYSLRTQSVSLDRSLTIFILFRSVVIFRWFGHSKVPDNYVEFLGELSFSAFRDMGCEQLLLVEGVHDVRTVQQLLRLVDKEHKIVVLPLGGDQLASGGREMELSELLRLSRKIAALVDSERTIKDGEPKPGRAKFVETCSKLGIDVCLTERRAIENYFTDLAVKAAVGSNFHALGPFESKPAWGKGNNWKIARQMTLADIEILDLGAFLKRL